ncbi:uncharacterized protein LOC115354948 isoform X4 [Myripristis murdjan]|uniref:uncharacterized protein LOC115354948 isoform X4 n=1 Tax=Myripristis murdjan TaxID=586833 RepID=UPI0011761946|nr:uncharacterized protein LOC115354948 isoform X4 [Myripristis murdjan]
MCAVQLLRVSVHERITAAAEDFLLFLETRKEIAEIPDLRTLLNQRLTAAAEEILGLFEKTVAEYEDKVHQSEKEMCRQRNLLNIVLNPEVKLHRAVSPPDTQQLFVKKKESRQPHIKEEQEEFPFTPFPVKHEDQEKAESSQLHPSQTENRETEPLSSCSTEQMESEADGEDCGGSPARSLDPAGALQPASDAQLFSSHSSESETEDSDDWEETREPQSGFKPLNELLMKV